MMFRLPAFQALLIQVGAVGIVLLAAMVLHTTAEVELSVAAAALAQGMVAASLAWWCGMPRWWLWIQFLFVPALTLVSALHLPSWLFLLLFIFTLGVYWQTYRTRVPFYPSTEPVWRAVTDLLPSGPARFVDLGSGFGGLSMHIAARRPGCHSLGVELAPLPWIFSVARARLRGSQVRFSRADYATLHLGQFDVVFAYLSPAAMPDLWRKANAEMRAGSLLLSYEFEVPGVPPQFVAYPQKCGPALYGWRF